MRSKPGSGEITNPKQIMTLMTSEFVFVSLSVISWPDRLSDPCDHLHLAQCAVAGHRSFELYWLSYRLATFVEGVSRSRVPEFPFLSPRPRSHSLGTSSLFLFSPVGWEQPTLWKLRTPKVGDRVDIVVVDDLIDGDFTDGLRGVHAVIHVAPPLPGHRDPQTTIGVSTALNWPFWPIRRPKPFYAVTWLSRPSSKEHSISFDKPTLRESTAFHTSCRWSRSSKLVQETCKVNRLVDGGRRTKGPE